MYKTRASRPASCRAHRLRVDRNGIGLRRLDPLCDLRDSTPKLGRRMKSSSSSDRRDGFCDPAAGKPRRADPAPEPTIVKPLRTDAFEWRMPHPY
jgi:hypothetical protein